jgi:predicted Zn finger-like uncharacterized protein
MALAARCPHCRALFRVVADQLKLRGGLVRCGECRQVFDAIGSLSYVDDHALTDAPIGGSASPGPAVASSPANRPPRAHEPAAPPPKPSAPPVARPREAGRRAPSRGDEIRDELAVPTLIGVAEPAPEFGPAAADASEAPDSSPEAIDATPTDGEHADAAVAAGQQDEEPEAPSFLPSQDQLREQRLDRALAIACIPLSLLAAVQIGLTLREDALESWPSLQPLLTYTCRVFGCTVQWPAHADLLAVIGSDLSAIPGTDVIELNAALRSRANFIMALPAIEVTLTDAQNRTIARKVFLPVDYLASSGEPSSRIDQGLAPGSDLSLRLVFEARGLNAAGFVLYPFYL